MKIFSGILKIAATWSRPLLEMWRPVTGATRSFRSATKNREAARSSEKILLDMWRRKNGATPARTRRRSTGMGVPKSISQHTGTGVPKIFPNPQFQVCHYQTKKKQVPEGT